MIALNIVVATFFVVVRPLNKEIAGLETEIDQYTQRAAQLPSAQKKLADATALKAETEVTWKKIKRRIMPVKLEVPNEERDTLIRKMPTYWRYPEQLTALMTSFTSRQKGVRVTGAFTLPDPGFNPLALPKNTWNSASAQFSATGDFQGVLHHLEKWNKSPRLVLIDGVSLSGVSPNLTATYSASLYQTIDAPAAAAVASAATPAAPSAGAPSPMMVNPPSGR